MRSRKKMEGELNKIKGQLGELQTGQLRELLEEKTDAEKTSSNLLMIIKMMMEENRKNNLILKSISENLARLENELGAEDSYEQDDQPAFNPASMDRPSRVQPVSGLDAKILQIIQIKNMASAEEIMREMGYKGRNAASARLNKLYRQGLLERHQLGHKVYYKYDAGKTANTLIVSPPQ